MISASFLDTRLPDRFWAKVAPCPMSGCWLWTAASGNGYGKFAIRASTMRGAHVVAYRSLVGDVRIGLKLDHKCRVRCCVNPAHLEPVTNRVNVLRGVGPTARNARKETCVAGHPFDAVDRRGQRICTVCVRERKRATRKPDRRITGAPRGSWQRRKTACPRGHAYAGGNLYLDRHGYRLCRQCNRDKQRERNARANAGV